MTPIDYHVAPQLFIGAAFVAMKITTGPMKRSTRRQVTVRFRDGTERTLALSTLRELAARATLTKASWGKRATTDLQAVIAAAASQVGRDPDLSAREREVQRAAALTRIAQLWTQLATKVRDAGSVLEPEDLDGHAIDLGHMARLAIAAKVMDS